MNKYLYSSNVGMLTNPSMLTYYLTYIISDINYVILGNPQDTAVLEHALIKSACDDYIIFDNAFNKTYYILL